MDYMICSQYYVEEYENVVYCYNKASKKCEKCQKITCDECLVYHCFKCNDKIACRFCHDIYICYACKND